MRTRTFSEEEKDQIKKRMMEAGIPLLREYGMTHMSITRLTQMAGIGKSTFYNFYSSKEQFVNEMLRYNRQKIILRIQEGLQGREKYTKEESREMLRGLFCEANNIYQHFTMADEELLWENDEKNGIMPLNLEKEKAIMDLLFSLMDGVRKDVDYAAAANLCKIIVLSGEQKHLLHPSGYERVRELLLETLMDLIFE